MINRRLILLFALVPILVCGQPAKHARRTRAAIPQLQIRLDALDKLAEKASEAVTVSLDGNLLQLASRFLSSDDPDQAQIKKLVASLKGVYVRNFEFEKTGEYQASDLEPIRNQLRDPKWKNIVQVRGHDNADVLLRQEDEHTISGLVVIVAEPKELTIVNIIGTLDPERLADLGGEFGIPRLEKSRTHREAR